MITVLDFGDGEQLLFATEDAAAPALNDVTLAQIKRSSVKAVPPGYEQVSTNSDLLRGGEILQRQLNGLAALARTAMEAGSFAKVELEAEIVLSAEASIPLLTSAKGQGALKLTLTLAAENVTS